MATKRKSNMQRLVPNRVVKRGKSPLVRLARGESGMSALTVTLVMVLMGAIIIGPIMGWMIGGLKQGQDLESRVQEYYAADAAVEDARYRIKYGYLPQDMLGVWTEEDYDPANAAEYSIPGGLNNKEVTYSILPIWALEDLEDPTAVVNGRTPPDAFDPTDPLYLGLAMTTDIVDVGYAKISIIHDLINDGDLTVDRIGVWLPPGFSYVTGSSTFEQVSPLDPLYCVPDISSHKGGTAVVWNTWNNTDIDIRPDFLLSALPESGGNRIMEYQFTPGDETPQGMFSWMKVSTTSNDVYLCWDVDAKLFRVVSQATTLPSGKFTGLEAYTTKSEFRKFGSAVEGDYFAAGGTLMTPTSSMYYRDRLFKESTATIEEGDLPATAKIEAAWLYWSGWIEEAGALSPLWWEDCNDFTYWDAGLAWSVYLERFRGHSGTPAWSDAFLDTCDNFDNWDAGGDWLVDSGRFRGHHSQYLIVWEDGCYSFSPNWQAGSDWQISSGRFRGHHDPWVLVWSDDCSDFIGWQAGSDWQISSGRFRGHHYGTGTVVWSDNCSDFYPNWTAGSSWSTYYGRFRGHYSEAWTTIWSDDCADFVGWDTSAGSDWSIDSGSFRGHHETGGGRYLTTFNGTVPDLSSHAGNTVVVSWDQFEGGDLEDYDCLRFAFSGDGGSNWSSYYTAFCNDSPSSNFSYTIPNQYLTDNFTMRFYLDGFDGSSWWSGDELCYIDNINISAEVESEEANFLTMTPLVPVDLTDYVGETVTVSWQPDEDGYLESDDCLKFAFSGDGGTTWSNDLVGYYYTAYCDDGPPSTFEFTIPDIYLGNNFAIRFYLDGFADSSEYAYIDNIQIVAYSASDRYLTQTAPVDLSQYAGETVTVSWDQDESGYLESDDCLRFAFSADGTPWPDLTSYYTAFCDDGPSSSFSYTIPSQYLTTNFRMRFYLDSFGGSDEYAYIDNIAINALVDSEEARYLTTLPGAVPGLSEYATETVTVSWDKAEDGSLESGDCLKFAFSGDGGSTWSNDSVGYYTAFCDDTSSSSFSYTIPSQYLTDNFTMRFYLDGFADSDYYGTEYAYIDNIQILAEVGTEADRYLTLKTGTANMTSYKAATVSWDQAEGGSLEDGDRLYFAFSGNGGSTWSSNFEAFRNDSPSSSFTYTIPPEYLTANFTMRFYLYGFEESDSYGTEYCYIDNIRIRGMVESEDRYLTMNQNLLHPITSTPIDLSLYAGETVTVSWDQAEDGQLEDGDRLYFAFSGDGGQNWSGDIEAFRNDGPTSDFSYTIPVQYLTADFRMRFYLYGFDESDYYGEECCYIDNIVIWVMGEGVEATKVNRVLFNGEQITTDKWQIEPTPDSGAPDSWSYSCFYDATSLVQGWIEDPLDGIDIGTDGSGTYVLGHWPEDGAEVYNLYDEDTGLLVATTGYPLATPPQSHTTRYQWSYAGWSLMLIYTSPETEGHYLYLFDEFRYVGLDTTLSFNVSGFLAPDSTTGSHLTYFVGEGDNHYDRDYILFNGFRLSDAINPSNNVFNSYSNDLDNPYLSGIDVDTFDTSAYIHSGDSEAEVVLDNGEEIYNLIYIILSFRSETTTGGFLTYIYQ